MGIPFVTSVPIRRNGATAVVPEPNFPAQPDEFVGRDTQIEAFRQVLAQGLLTGRTPSFAVLGDWGVGKSSLLLKYSAICSKPEHAMLPVFFSVSTELSDYKCFAESLLDTFTRTLETSDSLTTQFRNELQKWKLSRLSIGGVSLDRQGPEFFLTSGTAILKHALHDAWRQFVRPARIKGVIFFLDDLDNFADPRAQGIALALRNQFQEFAIHGVNYSLCSPLGRIIFRTSGVLRNRRFASTTRSISHLSQCRKLASTPQQCLEIRCVLITFPNVSTPRPSVILISWLS